MYVFISPHFDDAIGSCGCFLHQLSSQHHNVDVVTLFGGSESYNLSPLAKELHALWGIDNAAEYRREENKQACLIIGANPVDLDIPEALYRDNNGIWLYPELESIFGTVDEFDSSLHKSIADTLMECYSKDTHFVFPFGVGHHVDHMIAKRAGLILYTCGFDVSFYHDFSYSEILVDNLFLPNNKYFTEEDLLCKKRAMGAYTSQLDMLFGEGLDLYFDKNNRSIEGIYEKYYEIAQR